MNDEDINIKSSIITSILNIVPKISDENFLFNCANKINTIFDSDSRDFSIIQVKLFRRIIIEIARFQSNTRKYFNNSIKIFLRKHFLNREKEGKFVLTLNFLYDDAHIIFNYLRMIKETELIIELFSFLVNVVFDVNFKKLREDNSLIYFFFDNIENIRDFLTRLCFVFQKMFKVNCLFISSFPFLKII